MERQDDRTPEQRKTHTVLVGGTDRFLSGWGKAEGGVSYAFWACTPADADRVTQWVRNRGDIIRMRDVTDPYRPRGRGHVHIYVVNDGHPALGGA